MCVVSMIYDHYGDKWKKQQEEWVKNIKYNINPYIPPITDEEVKEFRELLKKAREYDRKNNEPNCELEDKKKKILDLAKELGIEDKLKFLD